MLEINYSFGDRLLHRLALGSTWVRQISFDLELYGTDKEGLVPMGQPIFISGLPRAGTTILMRTFHDTGAFRSLTYRDMPFVLMPGIWKRLSRPFHQQGTAKERAHEDGIMVDFDSPEAFEEIFWRTFCVDEYIFRSELRFHHASEEVIEQFRKYVKQVVKSADHSNQQRYLSKNNNNILRLDTIRKAFPEALIIIPFRDPIQQSFSILQQHNKTCAMNEKTHFTCDYMSWLGHHEFGPAHKPYWFGEEFSVSASYNTPDNVNYWLAIWVNTYRHLLKSAPANCLFFSFEELCHSPKEKLTDLFTLAGLSTNLCSLDKKIKPLEIKNVNKVDENLKNQAMLIFQDLSTIAHEFTVPNRQNKESF